MASCNVKESDSNRTKVVRKSELQISSRSRRKHETLGTGAGICKQRGAVWAMLCAWILMPGSCWFAWGAGGGRGRKRSSLVFCAILLSPVLSIFKFAFPPEKDYGLLILKVGRKQNDWLVSVRNGMETVGYLCKLLSMDKGIQPRERCGIYGV